MQNQKTYINSIFINEHTFNDGGSILKLSIPEDRIDELASQLKTNATDGWARIVIAKNRTPTVSKKTGKVISTHNASVDTWKPKQDTNTTPRPAPKSPAAMASAAVPDDVPF